MRTVTTCLMAAVLIAMTSGLASAEEKKKKGKKPRQRVASPVLRMLKDIKLTDEQTKQVEAATNEFRSATKDAQAKVVAVIGKDLRQARAAAIKAAREEGKTGKELAEAVAAQIKLTDEQMSAVRSAFEVRRKATQQLRQSIMSILTDEQKAALPKRVRGKKGARNGLRKNRKKKKKSADATQ